MTWNFVESGYAMPCLRDYPLESGSCYPSENCPSLGNYPYASNPDSLDHNNRHHVSFSYYSTNPSSSDNLTYFSYPQYQQPTYRDSPYVWIGPNNFDIPYGSTQGQKQLEEGPVTSRPSQRRHATGERSDRSSRKRRAPTLAQRRAANIRERRRMYNLNEAFDCLRQRIPTFAYEKRLSRIETLRLAISYISFMTGIVNGEDPNTLRVSVYDPPSFPSSSESIRAVRERGEDPEDSVEGGTDVCEELNEHEGEFCGEEEEEEEEDEDEVDDDIDDEMNDGDKDETGNSDTKLSNGHGVCSDYEHFGLGTEQGQGFYTEQLPCG
ncbi:uncharacterized protein LOC101849094 [Aplysia californica]|uniref:Uncharacterized protein LOC101849094 n=1 Tax=Aplysia californica TaxID=6500 RepID=A0ABM0JAV5_APLCA|nr:uncharacterized protein LOC101849094 [Aplysia californica]